MRETGCQEHGGRPIPSCAIRILLLLCLPWMAGGCYLSHLAGGQLHIVCASIPIDQALASKDLSFTEKKRLLLVQEVKAFAESTLDLKPTCNYSKYLPGPKRPLTYIVSAAEKGSLTPVTWWYPIVGRVSYKGFFDRGMALAEKRRLEARGYDVYMRPARAFSTLGWFCDPVIPTMLGRSDDELAELIIHELTHSTLFIRGDTQFNESLASFVAKKGVAQFFRVKRRNVSRDRDVRSNPKEKEAESLRIFFRLLTKRLRSVHGGDPRGTEKKEKVFTSARKELRALCTSFREQHVSCTPDFTLNNAAVTARIDYASFVPFEKIYVEVGGDWRAFFKVLKQRQKR